MRKYQCYLATPPIFPSPMRGITTRLLNTTFLSRFLRVHLFHSLMYTVREYIQPQAVRTRFEITHLWCEGLLTLVFWLRSTYQRLCKRLEKDLRRTRAFRSAKHFIEAHLIQSMLHNTQSPLHKMCLSVSFLEEKPLIFVSL